MFVRSKLYQKPLPFAIVVKYILAIVKLFSSLDVATTASDAVKSFYLSVWLFTFGL
jgi:hypothetical protein